jgi:hypothetical protein
MFWWLLQVSKLNQDAADAVTSYELPSQLSTQTDGEKRRWQYFAYVRLRVLLNLALTFDGHLPHPTPTLTYPTPPGVRLSAFKICLATAPFAPLRGKAFACYGWRVP